jgi:hypothetical protein
MSCCIRRDRPTIAVLERPTFNNARVAVFQDWIDDNTLELSRYWRAQGQALGLGPEDNAELDLWLKVQHHLEATRAEIAALVESLS